MLHAASRSLLVLSIGSLVAVAGCGRLYFDEHQPDDNGIDSAVAPPIDATPVAPIDAEVSPPPDAAPPACALSCTVDLTTDGSTCTGFPSAVAGGEYMTTIDMSSYSTFTLTTTICNPTGWLIDVSDSPGDDGYGGDGGQSMNDAEAELFGTQFAAFSNDYGGTANLNTTNNYIPTSGCTMVTWLVADQNFVSVSPSGINLISDSLLRINPPTDSPGPPDALWYLGLNIVADGESDRTGTGVTSATLCLN